MQQLESFVEAVRVKLVAADVCDGNVVKSPNRPSKDKDLPQARVFVASDDAKPYGSPRIGEMRFAHTTSLVVEVIDIANEGQDLKAKLCAYAQTLLSILLVDTSWGGNVLEGVGGLRQVYDQPIEGNHVTGRVQVQLDLLWTSEWPLIPSGLADLTQVDVDAGNGLGSTIAVPQ